MQLLVTVFCTPVILTWVLLLLLLLCCGVLTCAGLGQQAGCSH
jgi:hypothetical protein